MNTDKQISLDDLISQLQGCGMGLSLSKFVELNLPVFRQFKKLHVPQKRQADIVAKSIDKPVSVSSLAVALSRLKTNSDNKPGNVVIMKKLIPTRFVEKNAKLVFGVQKETVEITKNNITKTEERVIDWRGLAPNENITSWVLEYKEKLKGINKTGWRWNQIAEAINEHLSLEKKISVNTLTSIISLANKKNNKQNGELDMLGKEMKNELEKYKNELWVIHDVLRSKGLNLKEVNCEYLINVMSGANKEIQIDLQQYKIQLWNILDVVRSHGYKLTEVSVEDLLNSI